MQINIGNRIAALRTNKNVTPERFAAFFGVDAEVAARWESGEQYPSLEVVVAMAEYFGVTTDDLLGVEQSTIEDRVKMYTDRFEGYMSENKLLLAIDTMREALNHFPGDFKFKYMLMYALYCNCDRKGAVRFQSGEIISLGEDILASCTDDTVRVEARRLLCLHYALDLGETDRAQHLAAELPDRLSSREEVLPHIARPEERPTALQLNAEFYTYSLIHTIKEYAETADVSPMEKLGFYNLTLQLARLTHPSGDYLALSSELMDSCKSIAALHMASGESEKALDALEAAAKFAVAFDRMPRAVKHTSPLFSLIASHKEDAEVYANSGETLCELLLREMLELSCFEPLRYSDKLREICALLEENKQG